MVGKLDLFTTSNSDSGMSGAIVPFVKLYDGYFFIPDKEPCHTRYEFEVACKEFYDIDHGYKLDTFEDFIEDISTRNTFDEILKYEKIEIIEREEPAS